METISVAVAFASGEMASQIITAIDDHPFLDLCGIARSIPDLLRLLMRFRPQALAMSPPLLEELDPSSLGSEEVHALSLPVTFLISYPDMRWDEVELARMLRLPLRFGGLLAGDLPHGVDLFHEIKSRVELHRGGKPASNRGLRPAGGQGERTGLYTIMGTKGGVGTTLLTCALAAAISSSGRRVLLMEMDRNLSQLLYLTPRGDGKSLLDLCPLAEEISWDLIKVSVHQHAAGFHLLPYGHGGDGVMAPVRSVPEPLMRNLLFLFDVVIQDLPASSRADFLPMLHYCPTVLPVTLPDTLSATCARSTAAYLHGTGLDHDHLRLVVNRCGPHHALEPGELARAAGMELLFTLPDDPRSGLDFAELGELPRSESPLGKATAGMAAALGFDDTPITKPPSLQLFKRIRSRSANRA
ncbi:MAG: hypothetical protein JW854_15770 [Actinobacteria bacterium]|nr:hypothetical protein [Actinomycetota bacterium]